MKECGLLKKYGVEIDDPSCRNSNKNWAKMICTEYCPLDECIYSKTGKISKVENGLLGRQTIIPMKTETGYKCYRCQGNVLQFGKEFSCINCGTEYRKPVEDK